MSEVCRGDRLVGISRRVQSRSRSVEMVILGVIVPRSEMFRGFLAGCGFPPEVRRVSGCGVGRLVWVTGGCYRFHRMVEGYRFWVEVGEAGGRDFGGDGLWMRR